MRKYGAIVSGIGIAAGVVAGLGIYGLYTLHPAAAFGAIGALMAAGWLILGAFAHQHGIRCAIIIGNVIANTQNGEDSQAELSKRMEQTKQHKN